MTSNQIANATNVENHRHNTVMEDLTEQSNQISSERNQIQREYNDKITSIQEEYNRTYLALQESQGQRKLDLQEQLNWIEFKKANADADYKAALTSLGERDTRVHELSQQETAKYQKSLIDLGYAKNEIEAQLNAIKDKQAEYQKYYQDQEIRIQDFQALTNKLKVENDYSLGLIRSEIDTVRNELTAELQEWQEATMFTNSVWQGVSTIGGFLLGKRR